MVEQPQQPAEPILFVSAPLYAGKAWEQTVDYPGYGEYHYSFTCAAEEQLTVPFGTLWAYPVTRVRTKPDGTIREDVNWYCDGIGKIKFQWVTTGGIAELSPNATIPVERTAWGAVKSLYR